MILIIYLYGATTVTMNYGSKTEIENKAWTNKGNIDTVFEKIAMAPKQMFGPDKSFIEK